MTRCVHALVSGRVQGVAFRWATRAQAERLGVAGWVRNLADGRVEAWIEGDDEAVAAMVGWLASGPPAARVDGVAADDAEARGLHSFEIRPTARR